MISIDFTNTELERIRFEITDNFLTTLRFTTQDKKSSLHPVTLAKVFGELPSSISGPELVEGSRTAGIQKVFLKQLDAYFFGKLKKFDIKLKLQGTEFQKSVWRALQRIPYGQTRSYSDVARMIGKPKAVRAVANAVGKNRVAIIVPCHRVVRSDGSIGDYAWGKVLKKRLLDLESQTR